MVVCEEEEWRYCLFCVFADCMSVSICACMCARVCATQQEDALLGLIGFPFHSLHASMSGRTEFIMCASVSSQYGAHTGKSAFILTYCHWCTSR